MAGSKQPDRAHPRRCGADGKNSGSPRCAGGSSPQVRGRYTDPGPGFPWDGLIPAGAGQMLSRTVSPVGTAAHPRRCGADSNGLRERNANWGSSPQVRGRLTRTGPPRKATGLIPAGAGQIGEEVEGAY
ncbi:hypothetical protein HMPREF0294_0588 [Corynebacterium glucuronolyticum ATCC 51867]|nr:hypothetical protein HMPREF0294_0588 [Corynebacterium glucuronolyticum ATCC 51867]